VAVPALMFPPTACFPPFMSEKHVPILSFSANRSVPNFYIANETVSERVND